MGMKTKRRPFLEGYSDYWHLVAWVLKESYSLWSTLLKLQQRHLVTVHLRLLNIVLSYPTFRSSVPILSVVTYLCAMSLSDGFQSYFHQHCLLLQCFFFKWEIGDYVSEEKRQCSDAIARSSSIILQVCALRGWQANSFKLSLSSVFLKDPTTSFKNSLFDSY
jgi:hypothetical protein